LGFRVKLPPSLKLRRTAVALAKAVSRSLEERPVRRRRYEGLCGVDDDVVAAV
jgi:hypothetical protein